MREIFTDLYKKVVSFFQTQEKENITATGKEIACNRLKLVLMQDRTNLTPYLLERMRGEMVQVLAKYVEMDQEALELNFEQDGDQMALMLSIPVVRAKDEEEIQAILDAEDAAKEELEEESESEETSEGEEETSKEESEEEEEEDEEVEDVEKEDPEHPHQEAIDIIEEALEKKPKKRKNS